MINDNWSYRRIASIKPLPNASGCLKYDVNGKSNLRNDPLANQTRYQLLVPRLLRKVCEQGDPIMELNTLENAFFDDILNAEIGVPIPATLHYGQNSCPLIIVPEIAPEGYFRMRYNNAPASDGRRSRAPDGTEIQEFIGDELFGANREFQQASRERATVGLQLHPAPLPMQQSLNPLLNARILYAGPENKGELVLVDNQARLADMPLKRAEFSISGFHDFVMPQSGLEGFSVLTQEDHETLNEIQGRLESWPETDRIMARGYTPGNQG